MMQKGKGVLLVLYKLKGMFFSRKRILIIVVLGSIVLIALLMYINTVISNLIAGVLGSIVASIAVSAFYNEDLHNTIDKYNKIGLLQYFNNFEDAHSLIKSKLSKAKNVDIFVMYGDSFINSSSTSIQKVLEKNDSKLRFFMYSPDNKFIDAYGYYWGEIDPNPKYNASGIKTKIENVKHDLRTLIKDKNVNCQFEFYEILNAPISYSYYKVDNEIFFVPNKNMRSKEIKPPVFHFKRTSSDNSMYRKLENELEKLIVSNEVLKSEL